MATEYPRKMIKARDLKLADTIRVSETMESFADAVVKRVTDTEVTFFRPYGTHADFSYTGGVICYIGLDEYSVPRDDREFYVYRREDLK